MATPIQLDTIKIKKIIVHDIPHHKKNDEETKPNYSEQESKLSDGLRSFFKEKVVEALRSEKSFKVCFNNDNASPVSWIVTESLQNNGKDFVTSSKTIAKQLFEIQDGINAAGILVIIFGTVNSFNTYIILKLERDQGAQLLLDEVTKSFNIEEVKNLMLTRKTKIYKVALFIERKVFKAKFDGLITDYQINIKNKKEAITFFIEKFLGCKAFEDPKITTQKFYNLTRSYIETIEEELDRANYFQHLNSYIQKNSNTINPKEFADDYLKTVGHRSDYKSFLESKAFNFTSFIKDTNLIESRIRKFVVVFENDISIIGSKGTFEKNVKLAKLGNGLVKAEVTSKIKKMS